MDVFKRKGFQVLFTLIACLAVYVFLPEGLSEPGRRVLAVLCFAIFFWGLEIIPLYATSLAIILLLTFLLTGNQVSPHHFLIPFANPVIFLFFGGLILAQAATKHHIDQLLMEKMMGKLGNRTPVILMGILSISAFFSMWISNTAAAAMMLMLTRPLLKEIPKNDPFRKGIPLAIAFGASLGGIGTPIGSPPNAIAIGILREIGVKLNFLKWMGMAVPLMVLLLGIAALVLLYFFPPKTKTFDFHLEPSKGLTRKGKGVLAIGGLMILLWLTGPLHNIPESITALLGAGLFAAFGIIGVKDLRSIPWDVLILIWGGLAIGEAFQTTGLLEELVQAPLFAGRGYMLIALFCTLAVCLTFFINNTATANLLLPFAISVDPTSTHYLSITVALACSFALAFPISTPPNAIVFSSGTIEVKDMFKSGIVLSGLSLITMLLGYELILPLFL